jgi:nuclear receptor co-repressor 1
MYNPKPNSDSWDQQFQLKDQNDNMVGNASGTVVTGQKFDRDNSINWRPLKWTRSGSLSSRGSSFSHSSSSKSIGVDSTEMKAETQQQRNLTPVQSPSGDAAAVTSAAPAEEMNSRKKPRLGWGEGLAKYEKKVVDVPDEFAAAKNGLVVTCSGENNNNIIEESLHCQIPQPADRSPRFAGYTECCSPATPSSVACSSSPGVDDKTIAKVAGADTGTSKLIATPSSPPPDDSDVLPFNLENSDAVLGLNLSSPLNDLLKSDEPSTNNSSFPRTTAMNKLLLWKANISKTLEVTESEIDLLENELKSLNPESGKACPCPATSSSLPAGANSIPRPSSLELVKKTISRERENNEGKDEDVDSPGTATSKFMEDGVYDDVNRPLACKKDMLHDLIFTLNRDCAKEASEVFSKLLPAGNTSSTAASWKRDDPLVKGKFARRKYLTRFKERVMSLKFKAFQHLWKEDLRLLSVRRRSCAKSQKKFELGSRSNVYNGNQKHRSSIRSRFSSPAGNLSLVPTAEIIDYTSKLLSDSQVQIYRSSLKMPSLILDRSEKSTSRFISKNGLVEDPYTVEKERCIVNPWTPEEKKNFMEKFTEYGKDFKKISNFIDHKTTADCVEFYYKNHKSESFPKVKKKPDFAKHGKSYSSSTYLVTSGKRWNREPNATSSLDMLGEVSAIAANADVSAEKVAADVLAGICGSISSEVISSCITSSIDPVETAAAYQRVPDAAEQMIDEETCSDESCGEMIDSSDWTDEEKSAFVEAVSSYGRDFRMISRCVRTRSTEQCKVFFSKARKCLGLDTVSRGTGNDDEVNETRGSDTEDACVVQTSEFKVEQEETNGESETECERTFENSGVVEMEMKPEILGSDDLVVGIYEDSTTISGKRTDESDGSEPETIVGNGNCHDPPAVRDDNTETADFSPVLDHILPSNSDKQVEEDTFSQSAITALVCASDPLSTSTSVIDFGKMNLNNQCEKSDDHIDSSMILRGYPVTVSSSKGMNRVVNGKNPSLLQSMPKLECKSPREGYLLQDYYPQKCSNDKKQKHDSLSEFQFMSHDEKDRQTRPQSRSLSDEVRPCMNRNNVKLFGQILTHSNDENGSEQQSRSNGNSFNLKFAGSQSADGSLPPGKVDRNNFPAFENNRRPVRSYGFWDGNRIQTGYPSLPDSAVLLAKYPAAFGNYPLASSVSGSNHPFSVDMNQRQEKVGNLGGPCSAVSDPVAAIKLHFAKKESYSNGGTGGVMVREQQESWRGNGGDIGR